MDLINSIPLIYKLAIHVGFAVLSGPSKRCKQAEVETLCFPSSKGLSPFKNEDKGGWDGSVGKELATKLA